MRQYNYKLQNILYAVLEYIFVILVILNFRTMWLHSADYPLINTKRLVYGIVLTGFLCCILKGKINQKKLHNAIALSAIAIVYVSGHILVQKYSIYEEVYFALFVIVMIFYHFICDDQKHSFYNKYSDVVYLIAVLCILFWIFGTTLRMLQPTGTVFTTWTSNIARGATKAVKTYFNIYFEAQTYGMNEAIGIVTNINLMRNTGFFTEAPMFSFVLVLAVLIELFIKKESNYLRCGVLIAAVLTSFSSIGYILILLAVFSKYYLGHQTNIRKVIKFFSAPVIAAIGILVISFLVESKLGTGSGAVRVDDFRAGFLAWKDSPVFGNGFGNVGSYQKYMSSFRRNNIGLSNSLMLILSYGGVVLIIPYIILVARAMRVAISNMDKERLVFIVLFIGMLVVTIAPFQALPIYVLIESADYTKYRRGKKCKEVVLYEKQETD